MLRRQGLTTNYWSCRSSRRRRGDHLNLLRISFRFATIDIWGSRAYFSSSRVVLSIDYRTWVPRPKSIYRVRQTGGDSLKRSRDPIRFANVLLSSIDISSCWRFGKLIRWVCRFQSREISLRIQRRWCHQERMNGIRHLLLWRSCRLRGVLACLGEFTLRKC